MLAQNYQLKDLWIMTDTGLPLEYVAPVSSGAKYQLHNGSISTCLNLSENCPRRQTHEGDGGNLSPPSGSGRGLGG